jgi:hypothetical protein
MSKIYIPLTKEIKIQGYKFKIKALTFEDLRVLSSIDQTNAIEFTKTVMERGVLKSEADISSLPIPLYTELLKEIMDFSGLGQGNNIFNPSARKQIP